MPHPLVSVVAASFNRAHLLRRSIEAYNLQRLPFPKDRFELVLVDDGSTDETQEVLAGLDPTFDVSYLKLRKPNGEWRDCAATINRGLRLAKGELVIGTHPEVMVGRETVAELMELKKSWCYVAAKPYYATEQQSADLDTVPWRTEGLTAIRQLPNFYDPVPGGHPDYAHKSIETRSDWRSWVFGGFLRCDWLRMGGMIETQKWGSVDLLLNNRRYALGIEDRIAMRDESLCIHQYHPAPRVIEEAHAEAGTFSLDPESLVFPTVNNL